MEHYYFSILLFYGNVRNALLEGEDLNASGRRSVFETMGHLKPGVIPEQAVADLDSIRAPLQRAYPRDVSKLTFVLRHHAGAKASPH